LKALVAGLGVLVVLGSALVIGVIIKRIYANPAPPSTAAAPVAPDDSLPAGAPFTLPQGSKITGIAAADGAIAVAVSGPAGDQLWLVNPQTGAHALALNAPK
jgi:hypothetical protein